MQSAEPESNIRTVPVSLNGATRFMVLDTGGAVTQLSRDTIEELKLPVRRSSATAYDINGRVSRHFATVKDFTFGDLHRADAALLEWPESTRPFAGELAQDMLQPYDVDVDFASGALKMYAKGHCPGPSGWTPLVKVEMRNKGWHLHIPVTLDGHAYDAIFDTGSRHTIMRLPASQPTNDAGQTHGIGMLAVLRDFIIMLRNDPVLVALLLCAVPYMVTFGGMRPFLFWANTEWFGASDAAWTLLLAAQGVGAIAGALLSGLCSRALLRAMPLYELMLVASLLEGLSHVALNVRSVSASRDWYIKHLGLKVITDGGEDNCFLGSGEGFFLTLFKGDKPGLNHYCYSIQGYSAEQAEEKLKAAGLKPRREGDRVYFPDPDGIEVQVAGR